MFFTYEHRVSYAECTVGNHVYHSRYLDILERARGEFCRHIGHPVISLQEQDLIFPVIECQLFYLKPARYDDVLKVRLNLSRLSRLRINFFYEISRAGDNAIILHGETMHICSSINETPKRMPANIYEVLKQHHPEFESSVPEE